MNPVLLLAMFGRALVLQTVTFNANATWVAPTGVNLLSSLVGHGGPGDSEVIDGYYDPDVTTYTMYRIGQIGYPDNTASDPFVVYSYPTTAGAAVPDYYCENQRPNGETWCFAYIKESTTAPGDYHPPETVYTTGESATGFSKTFAGGYGGLASVVTYTNVAITSGSSYTIVVPTGATIQITYYA